MKYSQNRRVIFEGTREQLLKMNEAMQHGRYAGMSPEQVQKQLTEDIRENQFRQKRNYNAWLTQDPGMLKIKERLLRVSGRKAPVLITGPTGTGKGLLASALSKDGEPFVVATCGGLVDTLVPSYFFGYVRGAFTGANTNKDGYLVSAGFGIVLLDEIGDLPMHLQATLLHAIQHNEVYPVGAIEPIPIHCRFVAATNYNLEARVKEKLFREDLLARIEVFRFHLTGLQERPGDIELIARNLGYTGDLPFPDHVLERIYRQNVRGIENAIERWRAYGEFD